MWLTLISWWCSINLDVLLLTSKMIAQNGGLTAAVLFCIFPVETIPDNFPHFFFKYFLFEFFVSLFLGFFSFFLYYYYFIFFWSVSSADDWPVRKWEHTASIRRRKRRRETTEQSPLFFFVISSHFGGRIHWPLNEWMNWIESSELNGQSVTDFHGFRRWMVVVC